MSETLGFSGRHRATFLDSQLTPLLALAAVLLGVFAVLVTPREEEPQIDVTFANVFIAFPGASAEQVESLVASPMEQVLGGDLGRRAHLLRSRVPGLAILSVQFKVGEHRTEAIVRLYNAIYSNSGLAAGERRHPAAAGQAEGHRRRADRHADAVDAGSERGGHELGQVARSIETEIKRVPGTRNVYTVGAPQSLVRVQLDAQRLAGYGLTVEDLSRALLAANVVQHAGALVGEDRVDAGGRR